jgi:Domain of unknown function (DUF4268)
MELDSKGLGRLRRVANPRDVWLSESGDFTPWLADNLDVLAEELGLSLTLTAIEVPVGGFRLDIQAQTPDGQTVIIENQLERTDHGHLGQLLVYASGLEATAVVWIAPRFRDEFRRTLDWLNERTDTGVNFFGVELGVVQIDDAGPRAPVFEVVARPNDWQKGVKEGAGGGKPSPQGPSPLNAQRQDFFLEVLTEVVAARPAVRLPSLGTAHWTQYASGPFGYWAISATGDGRIRVEAYLDTGTQAVNKQLFDELQADAESWESKSGVPLSWERLDDKRASRIGSYHEGFDFADEAARSLVRLWATKAAIGMFDAMNETLRLRARQLRDAGQSGAPSATEGQSATEP